MINEVSFEITPLGLKSDKAKVRVFQNGEIIGADKLDLYSQRSRKSFLTPISEKTGLEVKDLDKAFIENIDSMKAIEQGKETNPLDECPDEVKQQAHEMLKNPGLFELISKDIEQIGIAGEKELCLTLYLVQTSRLLDKPLSGIVFGASASGKSYMIEQIARMMPPEAVIQAHDITDEALYYLEPGELKNKLVLAGERIEDKRKRGKAEDNTKALREMLASGKLSKLVTSKDKDGQLKSTRIEQEGPIAYLESTTSTHIHDEDATRLLPLITDESRKQTDIIIEAMKNKAIGNTIDENIKNGILFKHNTAQRLLKPYKIIIPYANFLNLPAGVVATRRAFDQLLSIIKSVGLLRQNQKEIKNEIIEADIIDYSISYPLIKKIFTRVYSPINEKSKELLELIGENNSQNDEFSIQTLNSWAGISEASVRRRLKELTNKGIISENTEKKPFKYKIENLDEYQSGDIELISPEDLEERIAIAGY